MFYRLLATTLDYKYGEINQGQVSRQRLLDLTVYGDHALEVSAVVIGSCKLKNSDDLIANFHIRES
ncbi:MAG: hypothetical protein KAJ73_09965, partial [Zetaproteobacteria bacterium]|nr:hypothetical protein [Zetaproteobacteria bacterium]